MTCAVPVAEPRAKTRSPGSRSTVYDEPAGSLAPVAAVTAASGPRYRSTSQLRIASDWLPPRPEPAAAAATLSSGEVAAVTAICAGENTTRLYLPVAVVCALPLADAGGLTTFVCAPLTVFVVAAGVGSDKV